MTHVKQRKLLRDGIDSFGEPVRAERWVILVFDRNGKSHIDDLIFDSEAKAIQSINEFEKHHDPFCEVVNHNIPRRWAILPFQYSHSLQLPVRT